VQWVLAVQRFAKHFRHNLTWIHPSLLNLRQHAGACPFELCHLKTRILQDIGEQVKTTVDIFGQQRQRHGAARAAGSGVEACPQEVEFLGNGGRRSCCRPLVEQTGSHVG
jgi:hypothetical protein